MILLFKYKFSLKSQLKKFITFFMLLTATFFIFNGTLFPAGIILKKGEIIRGTILYENNITIQIKNDKTGKFLTVKRNHIKKIIYDKNIKQEKKKEKGTDLRKLIKKYQLRVGILPGLVAPLGHIGKSSNSGLSGNIFGDILIPTQFIMNDKIIIRGGLSLGLTQLNSKNSNSSLLLFPILVYSEASYSFENALSPYIGLGLGFTNVSMHGDAGSANSFDASILFKTGTGYTDKNIPRVQFLLDFSYLIAFEKVNGYFIYISLGAAYQF